MTKTKESKLQNDIQRMFDDFLEETCKIDALKPKMVLPTGIDLLDTILGGGVAVSSLSIFVGLPGCGKSTLGANLIANVQKIYKGNVISVYLDSENSMSTMRLYQLGVKNPKIKVREARSIEQVFQVIEATCKYLDKNQSVKENVPTIILWDSIANTPTEKDLMTDDVNQTIGLKARMLSSLLPKYITKLSKYNIAFIAINQLRDLVSIGPFQTTSDLKYLKGGKDMPGGTALKFNAFQIVHLKERQALDKNSYGFSGSIVQATCVKNKLFTPNIPIDIVLNHNTGFSNFWTNYILLKNTKHIQSGAWSYLKELKDIKWQGTKNVIDKYNTNEEFRKTFDELAKMEINKIKEEYEKYFNFDNDDKEENNEIENSKNNENNKEVKNESTNMTL